MRILGGQTCASWGDERLEFHLDKVASRTIIRPEGITGLVEVLYSVLRSGVPKISTNFSRSVAVQVAFGSSRVLETISALHRLKGSNQARLYLAFWLVLLSHTDTHACKLWGN
jgi:hypothetical protein